RSPLSSVLFCRPGAHPDLHPFPTRRSSDLARFDERYDNTVQYTTPSLGGFNIKLAYSIYEGQSRIVDETHPDYNEDSDAFSASRSEEHTSELQSRENLVCRLLLAITNGVRS